MTNHLRQNLNNHKSMQTSNAHASSPQDYRAQPLDTSGDSADQSGDTSSSEKRQEVNAHDKVTTTRKRSKQPSSATSEKKQKTTYEARREEKLGLITQVGTLQKQLDELKYQVLVKNGEATKSNERTATDNAILQEFIQQQHLGLANTQAILAGYLQQSVGSMHPAHSIIRLGRDQTERYNTLVALKDQKLQEAKQFIIARSQGMNPRSSYFQEERNTSPGEDFCHVIFENMPVHQVSARDVFDAFIDVAQNAEIVISELFGSISIREDSETDSRDISQMRMVTSTSQGTLVESNSVLLAEFIEATHDNDESCGVIVEDYVDSDEMYPYKPEERARRDTTTVFMIRSFKQGSGNKNGGKTKKNTETTDENEIAVVATRWTCSKIRRSKLNLSADALRELQESTVSFGDTMKKCIEQKLGVKTSSNATPQ